MMNLSSITSLVKKLRALTQWQPPSVDLPSSSLSPPSALNLEALQRMVARIEAVLKDAEEREIRDESVRIWLKDLRDVGYEADDVLDEYEYAKVEAGIQNSEATVRLPCKRMRPEVSDVMNTSSSLNDIFLSKLAERMQKIQGRLEEISKLRDTLHLREEYGQRRSQSAAKRPPTSHLLMDGLNPQGREGDREKVIGMLLSDECTKSDLFVIPIVGIGGVGKTTLAQLVYNSSEVCSLFQLRGWVSISDNFELVQQTRKIIEVFTKEGQELEELSVLQEILVDEIKGKRFLLVLDDVWNEDPDLWKSLLLPLRYGKQGSAVITTTRGQNVATIMAPTRHHHCLGCLSKEDCWEVLKQNAFHGQDVHENYQELAEIGKQIAEKSKGLPLAAKSLGCLLNRRKHDVEGWRDVLESNVWDEDDKIIPALMLSYVHLPSHLKQCFLYASLVPKGFAFSEDGLVLLWLAQGLVRQRGSSELETVGNMYFDELVNRSFFQNNPDNPSLFVMHDLIHDLAQYISRGEHVTMEMGKLGSFPVQEARHLSLQGRYRTSVCDFSCLAPEAVRTVLVLPPIYYKFQKQLEFLTKTMLNLRVLSLGRARLDRMPDSIGNLIHLRYLNLQDNFIQILPDSVGKLYHLQTLILRDSGVKRLPTSITKLPNLQYLEVEKTSSGSFTLMPRGFCRLTNLRSLDAFNVGKASEGCGVEELKYMIHLRGSLTINNLQYVVDAEKAKEAGLERKTKIWGLDLRWFDIPYSLEPASQNLQKKVLENLRPHGGLTDLTIDRYCGVVFPKWLGDPYFSRLSMVRILQATKCPPIVRPTPVP